MSRDKAIEILLIPPILNDEQDLKNYILDKLDISQKDLEKIMKKENKNFRNFLTYYNFFKNFKFAAKILYKLNFIPKILYLGYFGGNY